ncbi:MAG: hypothetical protein BWY78_01182 [Alphaproteobacteria bacterium ADurb.Bin438]|nr:MAG: hypothetical protein BWY78_01182 [Alphaproteobacteria bacterium ADurb.Bin438]
MQEMEDILNDKKESIVLLNDDRFYYLSYNEYFKKVYRAMKNLFNKYIEIEKHNTESGSDLICGSRDLFNFMSLNKCFNNCEKSKDKFLTYTVFPPLLDFIMKSEENIISECFVKYIFDRDVFDYSKSEETIPHDIRIKILRKCSFQFRKSMVENLGKTYEQAFLELEFKAVSNDEANETPNQSLS